MMNADLVEISAKIDALGLWKEMCPFNFALRPAGTVLPYFVSFFYEDRANVKSRIVLLEGWDTFHDFVRLRMDPNFGCYCAPMELPQYELAVLKDGSYHAFRHDPGYVPVELNGPQSEFCKRLLWEVYGIMLRVESDRKLALTYADQNAMFSRVENAGKWEDAPLPIPQPRPYVEKISFPKADIKAAKDLPFAADEALSVDYRILPNLVTNEPRKRFCYALLVVDSKTGKPVVEDRISVSHDCGIKQLWEAMPTRLLKHLIAYGKMPRELRLVSGRVFRMLRPLCVEIPFKLSLHDRLPELEGIRR